MYSILPGNSEKHVCDVTSVEFIEKRGLNWVGESACQNPDQKQSGSLVLCSFLTGNCSGGDISTVTWGFPLIRLLRSFHFLFASNCIFAATQLFKMARLRMIQQALLRPWISSSRSGLLASNLKYSSAVGCTSKLRQ